LTAITIPGPPGRHAQSTEVIEQMRNYSTLCAAVALALLSACASGRNVEGVLAGGGGCLSCHGGQDNLTGAPPFDVQGLASSAAVGAHTAHLGAGVACASCHKSVNLTNPSFPGHRNDVVNVDFGAVAFDPAGGTTPAYAAATHTCSNVYCHAASTIPVADRGTGPAAPAWNAPAGSIAGCGACHLAPGAMHGGTLTATQCVACHAGTINASGTLVAGGGHLDGTVQAFSHPADWATGTVTTAHGLAATYQDKAHYPTGFEGCKTCHGSTLNNPIVPGVVPSCDSAAVGCHGSAAWRTSCTFCHGDALRSANKAAPPRDAAGNNASAAVGAHQTHLNGKTVSNGVACTDCHGGTSRTLPNDYVHANGTTEVTLKRPTASTATGTFDAASGTCASTYCHGNLPRNPKAGNTPSWTATSGQAACGACHAANGALCGNASAGACSDVTTGRHDLHRCARCHGNSATAAFSNQVGCFGCHGGYQRQLGTTTPTPAVVNFAYHVDGSVEVIPTTAAINPQGTPITITLTYTAPSGGNPASCTTNCHTLGAHGVSNPQSW
jgi:predicted CxxxxCH...CXXCH cytochrome family protein